VSDAWDGVNLKFTFRRIVSRESMDHSYELLQIASEIRLSEEDDAFIWEYNSIGRYSVQSMYAIVNNRGVKQIYTPVMWSITAPLRLHIFLWLLANGKVLTRDNLAKRRYARDKTCLFYSDF
jgi:hypothetical protein